MPACPGPPTCHMPSRMHKLSIYVSPPDFHLFVYSWTSSLRPNLFSSGVSREGRLWSPYQCSLLSITHALSSFSPAHWLQEAENSMSPAPRRTSGGHGRSSANACSSASRNDYFPQEPLPGQPLPITAWQTASSFLETQSSHLCSLFRSADDPGCVVTLALWAPTAPTS